MRGIVRIPFRLVDVFTDRPLAGNQLCVVPEPLDLPDGVMQALAREIGFSETTFVTWLEPDRYGLRIFMPGGELAFAGHPTLGTAFTLVSEGIVSANVTQVVAAGDIPVEVDVAAERARMQQLAPAYGPPIEDRELAAGSVGLSVEDLHSDLPVQIVSTGWPQIIVPLRDLAAVTRAKPDHAVIETMIERHGSDSIYLFHTDGGHARARLFMPSPLLPEDAATGSAAGTLGAYLAEHGRLEPGRLTISQGVEMGRNSTILVDVAGAGADRTVHVSGGVRIIGRGEFDLPV
jgi:trans-2,3-dihydro-3-hydroxyanthranilate isomerase